MSKITDVKEFGYEKCNSPDILFADVEECAGIGAIYENLGYLYHSPFVDVEVAVRELEKILDDMKNDVKNIDNLIITIAGLCLNVYASKNTQLLLREATLSEIAKYGFGSQVETKWANSRDIIQTMVVNPANTIFMLKI